MPEKNIHKPYLKPNANTVYVSKKSNHPPAVLKNLPKGVEQRLVKLSSNEECFNQEKDSYQEALNKAGYENTLKMVNPNQETHDTNGNKK